jgi:outer membrane protein assembly factor BamD
MKRIQGVILLSMIVCLSSCKWWNKEDEDKNPYAGMSANQLYTKAQHSLKKEQYATASKQLEAIETMYPFSDYTENAQMELMYAYYKNEEYPAASANYMKGLADFQQTRGVFAKILPMDESWRDPGTQSQAYLDFATLIQKFPNSPYKANSLQRMIYLRNMFAQKELNISQFYFKRKMYVAAIERSSHLVKNYPQAPSAKTALAIIYEGNKRLGLNNAAHEAMTVYEATYHTNRMVRPLG